MHGPVDREVRRSPRISPTSIAQHSITRPRSHPLLEFRPVKACARYWLPPLAWMALIWGLSTDAGSAEHTSRFLLPLLKWLLPWASPGQIELAHGLVRKCGHVAEYAVLAALWF